MAELKHFSRAVQHGELWYFLKGERDFMALITEEGHFVLNQAAEPSNPVLTEAQTQELFGMYADWQELHATAS